MRKNQLRADCCAPLATFVKPEGCGELGAAGLVLFLELSVNFKAIIIAKMSTAESAGDESLYPIAVLIDELRNEDVQVRIFLYILY